MAIIDYVIIAVYMVGMVGMVGIGFLFAGKNKSSDDYLVGGRGVGTSVFMATWLATCIGGGVLNGWIGTTYANGLSLIPSVITMYVLTAIIGLFMAEKVRSFGGVTTAQILRNTYGKKSQAIAGILGLINLVGQGPAMQTITFGTVLHVVTGIPFVWGCVISMAIIFLYTYTAGFWGVVMTDYVQFIIMCFGIGMAAAICFSGVGGWEGITASVPAERLTVHNDGGITAIIKLAATTALPIIIDGNRYQRLYSCKSAKIAKKGTLLCLIPLHFFYMAILLLGTCAYILLPNIKSDAAFSTLLLNYLPVGLRGIVFASLLAAIMSTCDSYLLCAASNLSVDIYQNLMKPNASDEDIMRVSKGSVIAFNVIGLAMAIWLGDIMSAWSLVAAFFVGGCFCPILYAIFFDKAKKSGLAANCAMILGGLSGGVLELLKINVAGIPPVVFGALVSLVVLLAVTAMDPNAKVVALGTLNDAEKGAA